MSVAIVTGACGLVGGEAARFLHDQGFEVVGIDNNLRAYLFGEQASTLATRAALTASLRRYTHLDADIRDEREINGLFQRYGRNVALVVHAAGQPSHDWAAREPTTDFAVNATGTLYLLEAARQHAPEAVFVHTSTNKVYGDRPNTIPLVEQERRWEVDPAHPYAEHGIDESMSLDQSTHSLFGVSKLAADLMVQEYGRYFGLRTGVFRCGCVTGPGHAGAEAHGFLSYLARCAARGQEYTVYGYRGKQVRDNIHSRDLIGAYWEFFKAPQSGAVFNMGGSRHSNCSVLEAIQLIESLSGRPLRFSVVDQNRVGDHCWWISDVRKFRQAYPEWRYQYDLPRIMQELLDSPLTRP